MIGTTISFIDKPIFIDYANVYFKCPKCEKEYSDWDGKYINRCNKNKSGCTKIKCSCGTSFFMTYDYRGDAVSF
jgi:hypothetical protein